ncbi:ADP-ribosylglycohydrolase family protein [Acinetobacter pittii]|uniref:ADP-ribosylglycohydrolase family protein n=1 Tax=Acinetobacter pittii TaxID=48296 RepID=UPI00192CADA3|nr:ADP-ribosylglycohydrolase family protein [Acinetobacter pittii]
MSNELIGIETADFKLYESMVISSSQWAAIGDALGWITELAAQGDASVKYRTGQKKIDSTIPWKRFISGKNGPRVDLKAGTYSDDTQLRLSVCRSIRGDGSFDVEAFSKIEVTVWPAYALGAGIGTKAAANNLSKKSVAWFSNFFQKGESKYINSGGNGAAMRIQPHVWASRELNNVLLNVMKDSIVTHGHTHGFCGAIFHAVALFYTLNNKKIPNLESLKSFVSVIQNIPMLLKNDFQLGSFWLPTWERNTGKSLQEAIDEVCFELEEKIEKIININNKKDIELYRAIIEELECHIPKYRGSGLRTALASSILAAVAQEESIESVLIWIVNELDIDTDTIATMFGAIAGALENRPPEWDLQDREYITFEAKRLAKIAYGEKESSFAYPDPSKWTPPANQASAVLKTINGLSLAGLGELKPISETYEQGNFIWQWFSMPYGQTLLAKYKKNIELTDSGEYVFHRDNKEYLEEKVVEIKKLQNTRQPELGFGITHTDKDSLLRKYERESRQFDILDKYTDKVIYSNFQDEVIGYYFNKLIEESFSLDNVIAFSAIIAKAKLARIKRGK